MKTENHVGHLKSEFDVQLTFEGDNNVLMQQVISSFSVFFLIFCLIAILGHMIVYMVIGFKLSYIYDSVYGLDNFKVFDTHTLFYVSLLEKTSMNNDMTCCGRGCLLFSF